MPRTATAARSSRRGVYRVPSQTAFRARRSATTRLLAYASVTVAPPPSGGPAVHLGQRAPFLTPGLSSVANL